MCSSTRVTTVTQFEHKGHNCYSIPSENLVKLNAKITLSFFSFIMMTKFTYEVIALSFD